MSQDIGTMQSPPPEENFFTEYGKENNSVESSATSEEEIGESKKMTKKRLQKEKKIAKKVAAKKLNKKDEVKKSKKSKKPALPTPPHSNSFDDGEEQTRSIESEDEQSYDKLSNSTPPSSLSDGSTDNEQEDEGSDELLQTLMQNITIANNRPRNTTSNNNKNTKSTKASAQPQPKKKKSTEMEIDKTASSLPHNRPIFQKPNNVIPNKVNHINQQLALTKVPRVITRQGVDGNGNEEILFYNEEGFTVDDQEVQRIIYKACSNKNVPDGARINKIISINFTEFSEPGATQWYHLTQEKYDLLNFVFLSLSFACGKKEKKQPPKKVNTFQKGGNGGGGGNAQKKKKTKNSSDSTTDAATEDNSNSSPTDQSHHTAVNENDLKYIRGNDHIFVFIETLVDKEGIVIGYRLWIFDTEVPEKDCLMSRGLIEALHEAAWIDEESTQQKITMINDAKRSTTKTKQVVSEIADFALKKEFHFSRYTKHSSHFTNVTKKYFTSDPCLTIGDSNNLSNMKAFRDDRDFMVIDTLMDHTYLTKSWSSNEHPCNAFNLLNKESAMIYHVCHGNVDSTQCRLGSYMKNTPSLVQPSDMATHLALDDSEEEDDDDEDGDDMDRPRQNKGRNDISNRFNESIANKTDDKNFNGFVHPNITYHLSNVFLIQDSITRFPLPHRIGTKLLTNIDQFELHKKVSPTSSISSLSDIAFFQLANKVYLGLHQTECEMSPDQMLYYAHHLDEEGLKLLSKSYATKDVKDKFRRNLVDELYCRLDLITSNAASLRGRLFINGVIEESNSSSAPTTTLSAASQKKKMDETLTSINNILNYSTRHSTHTTTVDARHIPYMSLTDPGLISPHIQEQQKCNSIKRLVFQRVREMDDSMKTAEMIKEEKEYEDLYYRKKLATGYLPFFKDAIEQERPFSNTLETIKNEIDKSCVDVDETFMKRNIFLRLSVLNRCGWNSVYRRHVGPDGVIQNPEAFSDNLRRFQDAIFVEFFHEFFRSPSVSLATLGIRSDLLKKPLFFTDPNMNNDITRNRIGLQLPIYEYNLNLRPHSSFITYINSFIADQGGITHNYKIVNLLYFAKGHHSRWHPECNNPKLNIVLQGNGMAGKSKALQLTKKTCPTGVGDMVTHITDHAFNVDRNLDDILLIYEEFQNKFLGYSSGSGTKNGGGGGSGGGVSSGSDKDTSNFFKARLTSGRTSVFAWCENEQGQRDIQISQASVQGNLMGASNNDFTDADLNVLSRLILVSVAKSKFDTEGLRPQDRTKSIMGVDSEQDREIYEQHRELHRIQFMTEKMIQSNILGDNIHGVHMEGAKIQINGILDILQKSYGIMTNDVRKREYVIELARLESVFGAVFIGLMSEITRHLQKDPFDSSVDIGFNPLVMLEGILPHLVGLKDHVIHALTLLSCLWYHDYQSLILESFATKKCHLHLLEENDFRVNRKNEMAMSMNSLKKKNDSLSLRSSGSSIQGPDDNATVVDYNYIRIRGKNWLDIMGQISMSLGDFIVADTDIQKLLREMEKAWITAPGYEMKYENGKRKLVLSEHPNTNIARKVVEFTYCPAGRPIVCVLVHFLKQKLADKLGDEIIEMPTKILSEKEKLDRLEKQLSEQYAYEVNAKKNKTNNMEIVGVDNHEEVADDDDDDGDEDDDENADIFELISEKAHRRPKKPKKSLPYSTSVKQVVDVTVHGMPSELVSGGGEYTIDDPVARERIINQLGEVNAKTDNLIARAIKDFYENAVLENWHKSEYRDVYESYRNKHRKSPLLRYITADPPKGIKMSDIYPEMKSAIEKTETGDKEVLFYDSLLMLNLEPKEDGKRIRISNYNTISPSVRASLSIYNEKRRKEDITNQNNRKKKNTVMLNRVKQYSETHAWEVDEDIDFISCREHMRNIGNRKLRSRPDYDLINYPPSLYMAILEKDDDAEEGEGQTELLEYPDADIAEKINLRKRKLEEEMDPENTTIAKYSEFAASNFAYETNKSPFIGSKKRVKRHHDVDMS